MSDRKLRLRVSSRSLERAASLASNTVLLAANAYLLGTGLRQQMRARREVQVSNTIQTVAEIAGAIAGLAQVVTATLDKHHVADT